MKIDLSAHEARVIGAMLEKQVTTPDQYPLSINGVLAACNQKSNRDPVLTLNERQVQDTLDLLVKKHLLSTQSGFGQRVVKYEQRFCNSAFGDLKFTAGEVAIVTLLLLRGAQTPGELRSRSGRLHEFSDMAEVEATLETLASREDGPFVLRLPREAGKRESRYAHLFSGQPDVTPSAEPVMAVEESDMAQRVTQLEQEVATIKQQLAALMAEKGARYDD
ncbi:hypothetical protein J9874_01968 [Duffyella gerundensis]|uniref:DUF480 domain-containing protein n=1 Tax=Duffyella gerundensis TaxID=1619313 RepID=UPI0016546F55|nr:DUF480 domain-containing protein [Duffyella gerundensis]UCB31432.1 hypothetical protein J9874_01968 [Duffyella gerundensis]